MAANNPPADDKLDIYQFGRALLETNDLDPVYVVLWNTEWDRPDDQYRWLLAYWAFYHVGTASVIAEAETGYWGRMMAAAMSKEFPRSSERRHYRGQQAVTSVQWLMDECDGGSPRALLEPLLGETLTVEEVIKEVSRWNRFGPWISFKVADMLERLGLATVTFDDTAMFLFDSPRKAAELLAEVEEVDRADYEEWAVRRVLEELGGDPDRKWASGQPVGNITLAPPRYERPINEQEAETILCKYGSYVKGKYHVGKDIHEVKEGLLRFAKNKLCQRLLKAGRKGGLW